MTRMGTKMRSSLSSRSVGSLTGVERQWTVLTILRTTAEFLDERGVPEARLSAEHLLADVLGCRRLDLYLGFDRPLGPEEVEAYRGRVKRRLAREPVQYITGRAGFRGLDLAVDPRVLVPRPETELLVSEVLAWARAEAGRGRVPPGGWRLVDVGSGSGAIAIALAQELGDVAWVLGTDASPAALEVARDNARRVGAHGTLWAATDGLAALGTDVKVDAVVANPPYVADGDRRGLAREVLDWEPAAALFAGPRGDEHLKRIVDEAPRALRAGGLLALEVGQGQAPGIRELVRGTAGLEYLALYRDHAGIERGVLALAE